MFSSWRSNGETPKPTMPSVDGAIEFWTGKDPFETYEWSRADICACGQYAKAIGDKSWMARNNRNTLVIWEQLNAVAAEYPRTFGALVHRVKSGKAYSLV